jgi:hypothetical protein
VHFSPFHHWNHSFLPRKVSQLLLFCGQVSIISVYHLVQWCFHSDFLSTAVSLFLSCFFYWFLWFLTPNTLDSLCPFSYILQCDQHSNRLLGIPWWLWHLSFGMELLCAISAEAFEPLVD